MKHKFSHEHNQSNISALHPITIGKIGPGNGEFNKHSNIARFALYTYTNIF